MKSTLIGVVILVVAVGAYWAMSPGSEPATDTQNASSDGTAIVNVTLPDQFSQDAAVGKTMFDAKCASCHGPNAAGQDGVAPPLVHKIYEPSHHGDESFQRAVSIGVRRHHWPFGDMAPVEGLTRGDVGMIVSYVRELQRANGIN